MIPRDISCEDRVLSNEQKGKLDQELKISNFKKDKLENDAQKNWDLFYKRNSVNFFKDRHWIEKEFHELSIESLSQKTHTTLLEVGCGCGNTIFPLFESNPDRLFVYACDFSNRAVEYVKKNSLYDEKCCTAFQCDLTKDELIETIPPHSVDIVTMFFVLSAISPDKMKSVLQNIAKVMKEEGGLLIFRDYGLYDHAMLRFSSGHKIDDNFYVRQDGTRAYYFSLDYTKELFESSGFQIIENQYILKRTVNKKEEIDVGRVFIQGRYKVKKNDTSS